MTFSQALAATATYAHPEQFNDFRRHICPEWVEAALDATGTATLRRRRLPAEQVVWLVIGMALFRDRSIEEVVSKLDLSLAGVATVAPSAIPQARARVGDEPMQWLFERTARTWSEQSAQAHRWRGLSLYGMDGSTLRLADTPSNRAEFGGADGPRGPSGYPLLRVVVLMVLRSHLVASAAFGPYSDGEGTYAKQLLPRLCDHSLTLVDRGFFGADLLLGLASAGTERHWLTRAKSNHKWRVIEAFGEHDQLVEMTVSKTARAKNPSLPETWRMRAIRYQRSGHEPQTLLTSLCDPRGFPAEEIRALYHERWEIELAYDELKTEMLDREETLRSKSPSGVRQEMWGLLLAYNLVRLEMERIAAEADVVPTRISFVTALNLMRDEWLWCTVASPGAVPRHLARLRATLKRYILPPRRTERVYPRAVKIKMSNYPRKRPAFA